MTDKEKIRDEIIKRLASCPEHHNAYDEEQENAYREILYFIDSMPVEPKFKVGDIVRSNNGTILKIIGIGQYCYHCDNDYSFGFNIQDEFELVEEPVSEDLEDELDRYLPSVFSKDMDGDNPRFTTWFKALRKTALHFADWQMQQMMKDAVDAFIYKGGIRLKEWPLPEKCGEHLDSVKVIIIKED